MPAYGLCEIGWQWAVSTERFGDNSLRLSTENGQCIRLREILYGIRSRECERGRGF